MKHILLFLCMASCLGFSGCQCSDKPDIGPVEGSSARLEQSVMPVAPIASTIEGALAA